jgi:hypothetical protein
MKYHIIKDKEAIRIKRLSHTGIEEYLVTKPSRNAAAVKIGTSPTISFNPSFAPFRREWRRPWVPGKRMLFPSTRPAAPAIIKEEISRVPWSQMTRIDFQPRPLEKK